MQIILMKRVDEHVLEAYFIGIIAPTEKTFAPIEHIEVLGLF